LIRLNDLMKTVWAKITPAMRVTLYILFSLYAAGVIIFFTRSEALYFVTQLFVILIFLSIGVTIYITEYSLANVNRIYEDVVNVLAIEKEERDQIRGFLKTSWYKSILVSVLFGLAVDTYIYLTEIKILSVYPPIYAHVYAHPILYYYFLVVGFVAGFSGGRAGVLALKYIGFIKKIAGKKMAPKPYRLLRIINRPKKIRELHELIKIAFNISIGGLLILGMAAYFILVAAQIVDPITVAILGLLVSLALGFFVIPQMYMSKLVRKAKEVMTEEIFMEFNLKKDWYRSTSNERKRSVDHLYELKSLQPQEFLALTSHLDYIDEIKEWPLDYKWFIAEFVIALIPFLVVYTLSH